jgi:TctA family transporter
MEVAFRQSLIISHGDFSVFITHPICLTFIIATFFFLLFPVFRLIFARLRKGGGSNA